MTSSTCYIEQRSENKMSSYDLGLGLCLGVFIGLGYTKAWTERLRYIHLLEALICCAYLHQYLADYQKNVHLKAFYQSQPPPPGVCGEESNWTTSFWSLINDHHEADCRRYYEQLHLFVWPNPLAVARDLCANTILYWLDYLGEHTGAAIHNFFTQQSYFLQILFVMAGVVVVNGFISMGAMVWMQKGMLKTMEQLQIKPKVSRFKQIV